MNRSRTVSYPPSLRWIDATVNGVATLTRPNDVNGYTSGDEISDDTTTAAHPWIISGFARANGGAGIVRNVMLLTSQNTALTCSLKLFDTSPTMCGDNAAFSHVSADDAKFIGGGNLSGQSVSVVGVGSELVLNNFALINSFKCAAADTSLYAVLVAGGAYTPLAQQTFKLRVLVEN